MTTEQTEAKTATETVKTEEGAKPKVQDSPEFRQALSQATSRDQRRLAEANKALKVAQTEIRGLTTRVAQIEQEAEVARLAGDDEEGKDQARKLLTLKRELDQRVADLESREERVTGLERSISIRTLSDQYGIPQKDLEDLDTVDEMEKAAMRYALNQARMQQAKAEPEKESKPVDGSDGRVARRKIPDPIADPTGYDAYLKDLRSSPEYRSRLR